MFQLENWSVWGYTLLSVFIVSLISLVGVITLSFKKKIINQILILLISLSAGVMLGNVFLHLIPEAAVNGLTLEISLLVLSGIVFFFILEKLVHWRHCHIETTKKHPHSYAVMNLIGDGLHNFIDGMLIAGSFLTNTTLGIATTLAVILHEIPQEIGDFGVLLHGGFKKGEAILFNLLAALFSVVGAVTILIIGSVIEILPQLLIPFTAGGFIYIAASDLIPQIHQHNDKNLQQSFNELIAFVLGIYLMYVLLTFG
jgi:zinc and cadmium transporter